MEFRIGINLGDVMVEGEQIYGDGVNVAARLQGLADAGGIFISGTVYDQIENKLPLVYEYLGEQTVKNIAKPVRVWRVVMDEAAAALAATQSALRQASPETRRVGTAHRVRITWPKGAMVLMSLLLLVGIIISVQYLSFHSPAPSANIPPEQSSALPLPDKPSIAVMPFKNVSGDPEQEYFGDGLTLDLITDLTKLSGLTVIFGYSVFPYKGKTVSVQEVGRDLGVRYVLEGSARKTNSQVLITAQLADATTGGYVWAERYERPLQDLFAVQEEVRRKILVHLAVALTDEEQAQLERAYTPNLEAYDYLKHAMESYFRGTPADNTQAQQLCEKAIALDPTYALAYAELGWTYLTEWASQWSQDPQAPERAFALGQKALALDDSLPHAHELLALIYLWRDKQHEQALAAVKRSVAHAPNWFSGYVVMGMILNSMGRPQETIRMREQVMRLDPQSVPYLIPLGDAYRMTGQYEEAISVLKRAIALALNNLGAHLYLAATYSEFDREEEARAEVAEVLRLSPQFSLEALGQMPYKDPAEGERVLAALRKAGLK